MRDLQLEDPITFMELLGSMFISRRCTAMGHVISMERLIAVLGNVGDLELERLGLRPAFYDKYFAALPNDFSLLHYILQK
jgi:hypothetical protein